MLLDSRHFTLGACAAAILAIAPSSAFASHFSSPATYSGTVAGGGTVSFDVAPVGATSAVKRFAVADVPTECGTFTTAFTGNAAITGDSFVQPAPPLSFSGSFPTGQQAIGSLQIRAPASSCISSALNWSASTTAPEPATDAPAPDQVEVHAVLPQKVAVATRTHEGLAALLRTGLRVGLGCPSACVATSTIELSQTGARRIGMAAAAVSLGKATAVIPDGGELLYAVKVGSQGKRALKGVSSIVLTLRTKIVRAGFAPTRSTRKVEITRAVPGNHRPSFAAGLLKTVNTDYDFNDDGSLDGGITTVTLIAPATDADGDPLSYSWTSSNGSVTAVGRRVAWERPVDAGLLAAGSLTVTVTDGRGGSASATFEFARGAG